VLCIAEQRPCDTGQDGREQPQQVEEHMIW
jgi:hypothetical protein